MKHKENNAHLLRQFDLIPMHVLNEPITIIGAGAIGSWVALSLVKMGFEKVHAIDFDDVSTENLSSQFYSYTDIGRKKVFALHGLVKSMTGVDITFSEERYEKGAFAGIVISAVDSMEVRKLIWDNHRGCPETRILIDPRMGAEAASLFVINPVEPSDQEAYDNSLTDDGKTVQERCTAKSTIYTANLLSGLVCKAVKDVMTRKDYLRIALWSIKENQLLAYKKKT